MWVLQRENAIHKNTQKLKWELNIFKLSQTWIYLKENRMHNLVENYAYSNLESISLKKILSTGESRNYRNYEHIWITEHIFITNVILSQSRDFT